ncbi:MAG: DUF1127 domain-containing protein [Pseudomonadota bacterium]
MPFLSSLPRFSTFVAALFGDVSRRRPRVPTMGQTWRSRRHLDDLSTHQLRDIGVTRTEAKREAARPFWDI